ncbi:MAG: hypothetical protein IT371_16540 [Deltaproteobacteria bacterium]|nr:hypothetical protein [Deltaproteobacteria bacterium]
MRAWRMIGWAACLVGGLAMAGCGATESEPADQDQLEADALTGADGKDDSLYSTSTYFSVRRDFRKCMSPLCGGYFVKRLNRTTTRCHDGVYAAECYAAELELSALGLSASDAASFEAEVASGRGLLRGRVVAHTYGSGGGSWVLGQFKASEGWRAASANAPTGIFRRMTDNGIRCIKAPCFNLHGPRLNSTLTMDFSALDLRAAGATPEQLQKANEALLTRDGVIVAGLARTTRDGGRTMVGSQFYLRVKKSAPAPLSCAKDTDCTWTAFDRPVTSPGECYCTVCPTAVLNVTTATANQASWDAQCAAVRLMCPAYPCRLVPDPVCRNGLCVAQ